VTREPGTSDKKCAFPPAANVSRTASRRSARLGTALVAVALLLIAARITALAGAGEVLVSPVVPLLMVGSGMSFVDRGSHRLKGIPGDWRLFAVEP